MKLTKKMLDHWLDVVNYWADEVAEQGENFPNTSAHMAGQYDKMIDEMYSVWKTMED